MYSTPAPMILFSDTSSNNFLTMQLKSTANLQHTLSTVTGIMNRANPGFPVEPRFVDEDFERSFKSELLVGRLSAIFAILAILISCLGLFGLAAYSAEQRSKEIGIRKVLGASVQNLAILLSKDFLQLVVLSCLLAFPVAWWYIYHWLENFEYRTNIGVLAFVLPSIGALLIALLTVTFQAIRAATANPVKNLRTE
jgi:ABC-type antimicrobial peptide transport system permease subunit